MKFLLLPNVCFKTWQNQMAPFQIILSSSQKHLNNQGFVLKKKFCQTPGLLMVKDLNQLHFLSL